MATPSCSQRAINPDVSPTDVESLRRHGVEPIILSGVGHFSMLKDPEQFNPVPRLDAGLIPPSSGDRIRR